MSTQDYMKVWSTNDVTSSAATAPSAPGKIINGRVAVHSIVYTPTGSDTKTLANPPSEADKLTNNRCYFLAYSNSSSDIAIKFGAVGEMSQAADKTGTASSVQIYNIGDGILFEDGVFLGKDQYGPDGTSSAEDYMINLIIFYTGGANV